MLDSANYPASWQQSPLPDPIYEPQQMPPAGNGLPDAVTLDEEPPFIAAQGPNGATGQAGDAGSSGSITGPTGPSPTGPTGPSNPIAGPGGSTGPTGPAGPAGGAKASIINTPLGNLVFSCFEGSRPTLFDVYRGETGEAIALRPGFVAACAPGTLRVFSVVPDDPCDFGADIEKNAVRVDADAQTGCQVIVAGTHKDFPTWDMQRVSEESRLRSKAFFGREWRDA